MVQYVILAAGQGQRFREQGFTVPKPLLPIPSTVRPGTQNPILSDVYEFVHLNYDDRSDTILVVINPEVQAFLKDPGKPDFLWKHCIMQNCLVVTETTGPIHSAMAAVLTRLNLDEPVVFLDCDNLYRFNLRQLVNKFLGKASGTSPELSGSLGLPIKADSLRHCTGGKGHFSSFSSFPNDKPRCLMEGLDSGAMAPLVDHWNEFQLNVGVYMFSSVAYFVDLAYRVWSPVDPSFRDGTLPLAVNSFQIPHILSIDDAYPEVFSRTLECSKMVLGHPPGPGELQHRVLWRPLGSPSEYLEYVSQVQASL